MKKAAIFYLWIEYSSPNELTVSLKLLKSKELIHELDIIYLRKMTELDLSLNLSPFGFTLNTQYRWVWCHFWSLKPPVPIHRNNNSDQYITFRKTHWSKWQFSFLGWTIPLRFPFLPLTAVSKHMKSLLLNDWAKIHDLRLLYNPLVWKVKLYNRLFSSATSKNKTFHGLRWAW